MPMKLMKQNKKGKNLLLDSGNKIAVSAHGMGSGGLAVDAMAIGCLGVERRVERFFSYLAIF